MSGEIDCIYSATDEDGFTGEVHIPPCDQKPCRLQLSQLEKRFQEKGIECIHEYKLNGHYVDKYVLYVKTTRYTILHKCPAFWWKIRNISSPHSQMAATKEKLICVSLGSSRLLQPDHIRQHFRIENTRIAYEKFFEPFHLSVISDESLLSEFVSKVATYLPSASSKLNLHANDCQENVAHASGEQIYETLGRGFAQLLHTTSSEGHIQSDTDFESSFSKRQKPGHTLEPVPDTFGQITLGSVVFARKECLVTGEHLQPLFPPYANFESVPETIASWKKDPDRLTIQHKKQRVLFKVLPELLVKKDPVCLAYLAVCSQPEIQDRALTFLNLLLLQGHLENAETKYKAERILAEALNKLRCTYAENKQESLFLEMRKLSITLIMLHCEAANGYHEEKDVYNTFNSSIRLIITDKSPKVSDKRVEDWFNEIVEVLQKSSTSMVKDIREFRGEILDEDPYQQAKSLCAKNVSTQVIVIYERLKKIFSAMRVKDASLLRELIKSSQSRRLSFLGKNHAISKTLMLNGLALFLRHGLRSAGQSGIQSVCEEIFEVFKEAEKDIQDEMICMLIPLLYDHTPTIRYGVIELLRIKKLYPENRLSYFPVEIERLLCPLLKSCSPRHHAHGYKKEDGWMAFQGKFCNQDVMVLFDDMNHTLTTMPKHHDRQFHNLMALEHPFIMKLFAYQMNHTPRFYIVEDYMSKNFQEALKCGNNNKRYIPLKMLTQYLIITVEALEYCHGAGIVHRNITAASLFLIRDGTLKLGGFQLAISLNEDEYSLGTCSRDSKIPIRWSAPESVKRDRYSKQSDTYMFGVLMYEVLTHGALPYSDTDVTDDELVEQLMQPHTKPPKLCNEECFRADHYKIMSQCVDPDPSKRPRLSEIKEQLKETLRQVEASADSERYPPLYGNSRSARRPSTEGGVRSMASPAISPVIQPSDLILRITPTLSLYKRQTQSQFFSQLYGTGGLEVEGTKIVFREDCQQMSHSMVEKIDSGCLEDIIPDLQISFSEDGLPAFLDYQVGTLVPENIASFIVNRRLGQQPQRYLELLLQVAQFIEHLHERNFVIGHTEASHLYVEEGNHGVKVHVVSFAYLNTIEPSKTLTTVQQHATSVGFRCRAAPEVRNNKAFTPESDVCNFGYLLWEILACIFDRPPLPVENIFTAEGMSQLKAKAGQDLGHPICNLIKWCISYDEAQRPTMMKLIEDLHSICQKLRRFPGRYSQWNITAHQGKNGSEWKEGHFPPTDDTDLLYIDPSDELSISSFNNVEPQSRNYTMAKTMQNWGEEPGIARRGSGYSELQPSSTLKKKRPLPSIPVEPIKSRTETSTKLLNSGTHGNTLMRLGPCSPGVPSDTFDNHTDQRYLRSRSHEEGWNHRRPSVEMRHRTYPKTLGESNSTRDSGSYSDYMSIPPEDPSPFSYNKDVFPDDRLDGLQTDLQQVSLSTSQGQQLQQQGVSTGRPTRSANTTSYSQGQPPDRGFAHQQHTHQFSHSSGQEQLGSHEASHQQLPHQMPTDPRQAFGFYNGATSFQFGSAGAMPFNTNMQMPTMPLQMISSPQSGYAFMSPMFPGFAMVPLQPAPQPSHAHPTVNQAYSHSGPVPTPQGINCAPTAMNGYLNSPQHRAQSQLPHVQQNTSGYPPETFLQPDSHNVVNGQTKSKDSENDASPEIYI